MTVRIAPQAPAHASALFEALRDPRIYAFLDGGPPASAGEVEDRIRRLQAGAPPESGQTWLNWTVFEGDTALGYTQATIEASGTASLAYVLSPRAWGRSVAYEACRLTLAQLSARPDVTAFIADTEDGNARSRALLARLGFRHVRTEGTDLHFHRAPDAEALPATPSS